MRPIIDMMTIICIKYNQAEFKYSPLASTSLTQSFQGLWADH